MSEPVPGAGSFLYGDPQWAAKMPDIVDKCRGLR